MSATIQVAQNHDNTAGLANLDPPPMFEGLEIADMRIANSGKATSHGYMKGTLDYGALDDTAFSSVLTQLGLDYSTAPSAEITIRLPDNEDRTSTTDYNAIVYVPRPQRRHFWDVKLEIWIIGAAS